MSQRKTDPSQDPRFVREERDNRGTDHSSPRQSPYPLEGASDVDMSTEHTPDGGMHGTKNPDQGEVGTLNEATTPTGGIAITGGKLAGNKDDFDGDLHDRPGHPVPGAHPENEIKPSSDIEDSRVDAPGNEGHTTKDW